MKTFFIIKGKLSGDLYLSVEATVSLDILGLVTFKPDGMYDLNMLTSHSKFSFTQLHKLLTSYEYNKL